MVVTGRNSKGISVSSTQMWKNLTVRVLYAAGRFAQNDFMVAINYGQMVVSISTFLTMLMFIPDLKKKPFCWKQPFFIRVFSLWWWRSPHSKDSRPIYPKLFLSLLPTCHLMEFCVSLCLPSF